MPNDYYNNQQVLNAHELAKGSDVENKLDSVEAGFDKLPSTDDFATILSPYITTALSGNEYSVSLPDVTAYTDGMTVNAKVDLDNPGAVTININGLGSVSLVRPDFSQLIIGDMIIDGVLECRYNGTVFVVTSGSITDVIRAENAASSAESSETASGVSETNAATSETNAATSETNAVSSETASGLSQWEAEASRRTSESYAIEPVDTFVNIHTSDGDGTYTITPTTEYSALHWKSKAEVVGNGGLTSVVGGTNIAVDNADPYNPIVAVTGKVADSELLDGLPLGVYQTTHWDEVVTTDFLGNTDVGKVMAFYDKNVDTDENAWFISHQGTEFSIGNWSGSGKIRIRADGTVQMSSNPPVWDDEICNKGYTDGDNTLAATGHQDFPGGLITKWGSGTSDSTGIANTFAEAFPTACVAVMAMHTYSSQITMLHVINKSTTGFTAKSGSAIVMTLDYIAIGY